MYECIVDIERTVMVSVNLARLYYSIMLNSSLGVAGKYFVDVVNIYNN